MTARTHCTNGLVAAALLGATSPMLAGDYALRGVTVVDVERGATLGDRTILIDGERIARIDAAGSDVPDGYTEIDGAGMYVIPGLFDAHVHFSASPQTFGPMLVANGITCVRDTGAPTAAILALRSSASDGSMMAPRIVATGAIIDGDPPIWPFSEVCATPEEGRAAVRRLADAGVDQIKVYERLEKDVYAAIVDEVHARGLRVTGHVPQAITLEDAMAAGQDCIEHLGGFDRVVAKLAGFTPVDPESIWSWYKVWPQLPQVDPNELDAFLAGMRENGVVHCPTLTVTQGVARSGDGDAGEDPRMAYVPPSLRSFWDQPRGDVPARMRAALPHMRDLVGHLHRAGVPLMIGTDLGNPYLFAGFAVHEEMRMFAEAGVPALDVLRAATIVPARFCGVDDDLGSVTPGKLASLVLVRGDPTKDVSHASAIEAVFLNGRYLDRAALDGLLAAVRAEVAALMPAEAAPEAPVALELSGDVVRLGRYRSTFAQAGGQSMDAGVETFVISRDSDGWHVGAQSRPKGGMQTPFTVRMHADGGFAFRSAVWRTDTETPTEARYTIVGGQLEAEARRGETTLPKQLIDMPDGGLVTAPAWITDFLTLGALDLAVGEERSFDAVGFGSMGWQARIMPVTVRRDEDTTIAIGGGPERPARYYTWVLKIPTSEITSKQWVDEDGVPMRIEMTIPPWGVVTAELETAEQTAMAPDAADTGERGLVLLVAVPCLNEEKTVARVVEGIPRAIPGIARIEVLVIDDGSSDRTGDEARTAGAAVVTHATCRGLGVSFREAVEIARTRGADVFVNIDGDGQFDPAHIPELVAPVVEGRAHMATASRFLPGHDAPEMPAVKQWGNHGVALIVAMLTGRRFRDVSCGFRAFSREALLRMNLFGSFTYTQECFLDLVFKELNILELPVPVRGVREFGGSRVASSLPLYAWRSLKIMLRAFISYRPFRLFSALAAVFLAIGLALLVFLGVHYIRTHAFSPHIWSGFVGGSFAFLGILTLVIGLIGDMLVRIRMNQESVLYYLRRAEWEKVRTKVTEPPRA